MKLSQLISLSLLIFLCSCKTPSKKPEKPKSFSLEDIAKQCEVEGIRALVHGADHKRRFYVISWSNPKNFFNRYNLSIISKNAEINKQIATLNRGDYLFIKGPVKINKGQAHAVVEELVIKKRWDPKVKYEGGSYKAKTELPGKLITKSSEQFYIHATDNKGKILILEYGDTIVPMYIKNGTLTENLHRGDYVELAYKISKSDNPKRPTHLILDESTKQPVKVLDEVVKMHKQDMDVTGRLVMFPKSPTINNNVFAVEVRSEKYPDLASRYFTIVPKDFKPESFKAFREKFHAEWDKDQQIFKGRNKYIHLNLKVNIKGIGNVVSKNQANAQIFTTLEQITIIK